MEISNTPKTKEAFLPLRWIENRIKRKVQKLNILLARCDMTLQVAISIMVIALLAFLNAGILYHAIHDKPQKNISIQSIPFSPMDTGSADSVLTREEFNKLLQFNHMLDSLRSNPQTQTLYMELMRMHPGIRDSINYLLKHYPPMK